MEGISLEVRRSTSTVKVTLRKQGVVNRGRKLVKVGDKTVPTKGNPLFVRITVHLLLTYIKYKFNSQTYIDNIYLTDRIFCT